MRSCLRPPCARLSDALGHTVGAAMTRGEPLTAARLLDTGISAALAPGQVALTIGLAAGNQAAILQAGALIDLYATALMPALHRGPSAARRPGGRRLGTSVRVLAVAPPARRSGSTRRRGEPGDRR